MGNFSVVCNVLYYHARRTKKNQRLGDIHKSYQNLVSLFPCTLHSSAGNEGWEWLYLP